MTGTMLFNQFQIRHRVRQMAEEITKDWKPTVIVPILNGAWFFASDLMLALQSLNVKPILEPIGYRRDEKGRPVLLFAPPVETLLGEDVLLVDCICDSGSTAMMTTRLIHDAMHPVSRSLAYAFLVSRGLGKPNFPAGPSFVGFELGEDKSFVWGYGMDNRRGSERAQPWISAETTWTVPRLIDAQVAAATSPLDPV